MPLLFDPGLQPQRTAMAWLRTAALAWVVFLLLLRMQLQQVPSWPALAVLGSWLLLALALTVQYLLRSQALLQGRWRAVAAPTLAMISALSGLAMAARCLIS